MNHDYIQLAQQAAQHAHSPYSHCKVGAAIVTQSGKVFTGCNIENASYGATVCAERVAIWKAVSEIGKITIKEIYVATEQGWPPCGQCRQVMAEFSTPDTQIHLCTKTGIKKTYLFDELQPEAFSSDYLLKK